MTLQEFSDGFDTLVSSYRRFKDFDNKEILDSIEFDEYEKSFYLTKAQEEIVTSLYNGKNPFGDSFELTEELRRLINNLVTTVIYNNSDAIRYGGVVSDVSKVYRLPEDMMFIILEQVVLNDTSLGCYNDTTINVYPVKHDEYNKIKDNPFRGATKYKALRLDLGEGPGQRQGQTTSLVEIICKYLHERYLVRYVRRPVPIILEDLPNGLTIDGISEASECELSPILHNKILERAVLMALRAKGINTDK